MNNLKEFISSNENLLIEEASDYAKKFRDISFLAENKTLWTNIIKPLNKVLIQYFNQLTQNKDICKNNSTYFISIALSIILEGKRHFSGYKEPGYYLSILKCCSRSYKNCLQRLTEHENSKINWSFEIDMYFDNLEIVLCNLWAYINKSEIVRNEGDYSILTEILPGGIAVLCNNKIVYINSYIENITEYTMDELHNVHYSKIIHTDYIDIYKEEIKKCANCTKGYSGSEIKIISKSGKEKWLDIRACSTFICGERITLISVNDITSHKELQDTLKQREEQLLRLINAIPGFVAFKDSKGKWVEANEYLVKLFKIEDINFKGMCDLELAQISTLYSKEFINCAKSDEIAWSSRKTIHYEEIIKNHQGEEATFDVVKAPIYNDDGSRRGIVALGIDITERKKVKELNEQVQEGERRLKEAIESEKIKTEFFANMSHELRTPINVIFSAVQFFEFIHNKEQWIGEKYDYIDKYISIIKQNCYRLEKLVNNLLDVTRINAGYYDISLQNCNIVNIVEDITLSIVDYAELKGIAIVFDTDVEEKKIACDPDKIERIILNLLSNAVKFTQPGGTIVVNINDRGSRIFISVKDNGIGIPKEKQSDIFERFVQVDKSLSRNCEGSGMGLFIVKSLVDMHNGSITVKSRYGEGSEFIIELPAELTENSKALVEHRELIQDSKTDTVNIEFSDIYA